MGIGVERDVAYSGRPCCRIQIDPIANGGTRTKERHPFYKNTIGQAAKAQEIIQQQLERGGQPACNLDLKALHANPLTDGERGVGRCCTVGAGG